MKIESVFDNLTEEQKKIVFELETEEVSGNFSTHNFDDILCYAADIVAECKKNHGNWKVLRNGFDSLFLKLNDSSYDQEEFYTMCQ